MAIFTSCTIDEIHVCGETYTIPGGPGLYSSLMAKFLRFDVDLYSVIYNVTQIREILKQAGVSVIGKNMGAPTKFSLVLKDQKRELKLVHAGPKIEYNGGMSSECTIVTPVYDEIAPDTFKTISSEAKFMFLDPQGFLRRTDKHGNIRLDRTDVPLDGVCAIKIDDAELLALTGTDNNRLLVKAGIDHVLYTHGSDIRMLSEGREYKIKLSSKNISDTTGLGDIFSSSFCCTIIRENDPLWAFCFACGAVNAAIDSHKVGIDKIPSKRSVETSAAYFYNTVEFSSL